MSIVRNAIGIRVNTALTGQVGCTPELIDAYLKLLEADVIPVVRRTGSIGCADMPHGTDRRGLDRRRRGRFHKRGRRMQAADAFAAAGIQPTRWHPATARLAQRHAVSFAAAADATRNACRFHSPSCLATGMMACGALGASRDPWRSVRHVGTARARR